jgi:hypothetical protein
MQFKCLKTIAVGLLSVATASDARAQYYGSGNVSTPSGSQAYSRGLAGSADQGKNITSFSANASSGGWGWGGGYGSSQQIATPWSSQYGGWIQPAASYWAQDDIARQQAYTQKYFQSQDYQLRQMQLKRAAFDEMRYEKMNTPPPEVIREENRMNRLSRARNTPPLDEIASGQALNELLNNLQRVQAREGLVGDNIPLDQTMLSHINVTTTGNSAGSNEMMKASTAPEWPNAFATEAYAANKKGIEADMAAMAKAQENGRIDSARVADARRKAAGLKDTLYGDRFKVSFRDYVDALEFLSKLENTIEILAKQGAKNFLDGTYAAKGKTVSELVSYMISKGLQFAAATPGREPDYYSLYQQLVTYDLGIARLIGERNSASSVRTPGQ